MADAEIVTDLERVLAQIKARGHQTIEIDDLLRLVEEIKREKGVATQLILQGEEHGHSGIWRWYVPGLMLAPTL